MTKRITLIIVLLVSFQTLFSQQSGVVSFDLPSQNSLKFNKYTINPTFSFVKEDRSIISLYNKRQWTQFENAPLTYFLSYTGKFSDQNAVGFGLFQQNYGILSTTGGIANYAHNVLFSDDSNLTFGINVGIYKSGPNNSKIITYETEPNLQNLASNTLLSISPGINYGIGLFDLGLSYKNAVLYNFANSQSINPNPDKSIQGHIMYSGFVDSYGFLDESKFSALLKVDKKTDKTIISGIFMFDVPKLGWAQAGYNNLYGVSAGLGFNITKNISIGYNFEKTLGDLSGLGLSHEIHLAYIFDKSEFYEDSGRNSGNDIVYAPVKATPVQPKEPVVKVKTTSEIDAENKAKLAEQQRLDAITKARAVAAATELERINKEKELIATRAANKAKFIANEKAIADAKALANAKAIADAKARAEKLKSDPVAIAAAKAKADADAAARVESDRLQKIKNAADKAKADATAKLLNDAKNKANAEANRLQKIKDAANKAKADAAEKLQLAAENKANAEANRLQKIKDVADKAKADAAEKLQLASNVKAKAEADRLQKIKDAVEKARLDAESKAIADADKIQKAKDAAAKSQTDAIAKAKLDEENRIKAEVAAKAKLEADAIAKVKLDEENRVKAEANKLKSDAQKTEADRLQKLKDAADKAKADAAEKVKLDADAKAKAEADRLQKLKDTADKAKADAEIARKEKEEKDKRDAAKTQEDKALEYMKNVLDESKKANKELLDRLDLLAKQKAKDLQDLIDENNDPAKAALKAPKEFVPASVQAKELNDLKNDLTESGKSQKEFLDKYVESFNDRLKKFPDRNDPQNLEISKDIEKLKAELIKSDKAKSDLEIKLDRIKTDIDIEKKRRIKRAESVNLEGQYAIDRESLKTIKATTSPTTVVLTSKDFDFGDTEKSNFQIIKKVENSESGYYLIVAVHTDVAKRDAFLTKMVASGQKDVDFFYNKSTGKYMIYNKKYSDLGEATKALETKENKPFNDKMFIVKIEN